MAGFRYLKDKLIGQVLNDHGYHKNQKYYVNFVSDEVCFVIFITRVPKCPYFQTILGVIPYCTDINAYVDNKEDIADLLEFDSLEIYRRASENPHGIDFTQAYLDTRCFISPTDDYDTENNIIRFCKDLGNVILPYFHKFSDLEIYYHEEQQYHGWNDLSIEYLMLSLKLCYYNEALHCIDNQLIELTDFIESITDDVNRLKFGSLSKSDIIAIKNNANHRESLEIELMQQQKKYNMLLTLKDKVIKRDESWLNNFIQEIERKNADYLRSILNQR